MRIRYPKARTAAVIPTASMADIVFLLIIFFVLTFNVEVDKTRVDLPKTNLRLSADEGKTWSDSVQIDDVFGAYPSMVNLRNGSVLVVYYEERAGSDIRARRFRVAKGAVEWLEVE